MSGRRAPHRSQAPRGRRRGAVHQVQSGPHTLHRGLGQQQDSRVVCGKEGELALGIIKINANIVFPSGCTNNKGVSF